MACLEKTEARLQVEDEPASVDTTPEAAHEQEVPREDADVMPVGTEGGTKPDPEEKWVPKELGRRPQRSEPFCTTQNSTNKGHYPGVLWTPEGIGRCPQRDDPSCASGTTQLFINEGYDPGTP
jgi:hypothetical protein